MNTILYITTIKPNDITIIKLINDKHETDTITIKLNDKHETKTFSFELICKLILFFLWKNLYHLENCLVQLA